MQPNASMRPALLPLLIALAFALSACATGRGGLDDGASGPVTLLSVPVEGAKISRGFGMWRHPILGYRRMHRGIDFAVPRGTPVLAAGTGVVEVAGWHGGYGRYIRIRHNSGVRTVYAHLSYIDPAVRQGSPVTIGATIGRTGSSGLSTGPHLHYEVWRGDVAIDPSALHRYRQFVLRDRQLSARD